MTLPDEPPQELSNREVQVLQLVADGHSNVSIGRELYLSPDTVKTHMRRIMRKLCANGSRAHAVAIGFRTGIIE